MPVVNPNFKINPLNYGAAVQSGQRIRENRLRNEALGMETTERRNQIKQRQEAAQIRAHYDAMPAQIEALENAGLYEQAEIVRKQYIQQMRNSIELGTSVREGLNKENYKGYRQQLIQAGVITGAMWPVEYSDDWLRNDNEKRKSTLQKLTRKWADGGSTVAQDLIARDGDVVWEGSPYAGGKDGDGTGKNFTFKASDANAIGRQVERVFGGFYDPETGQLRGLDPKTAVKVQSVQEEAERIYTDGQGRIPHGVAVTQAARRLRINIEDFRNESANDPLGLMREQ